MFLSLCVFPYFVVKNYSHYISEVSYTGQYPDMPEFKTPWINCIQVSQGRGRISRDKTLQSEGFGKCAGLIVRNRSTLESALFHLDDIDLTYMQTPSIKQLMNNYIKSLAPLDMDVLIPAMRDITGYNYPGSMKREDFQSRMEELNSDNTIQARFVRGDVSRDLRNRITDSLLGYLGIKVLDDITVNTGQIHWAMIYKPKESIIMIDARKQDKVLTYEF